MISQFLRRHGLKFSLVLSLFLTACSNSQAFSPTCYKTIIVRNQPKINLDVADLRIVNAALPDNNPNSLREESPVSLVGAIEKMAGQRLVPVGSEGQAEFIIKHAAVQTVQGTIVATAAVQLVVPSGGKTIAARTGYVGANYINIDAASLSFYPAGGEQAVKQAIYLVIQKLIDKMDMKLTEEARDKLSPWVIPSNQKK